jgi:hypothetical protein
MMNYHPKCGMILRVQTAVWQNVRSAIIHRAQQTVINGLKPDTYIQPPPDGCIPRINEPGIFGELRCNSGGDQSSQPIVDLGFVLNPVHARAFGVRGVKIGSTW